MGYTHYFSSARDLTDAEWAEMERAANKIISHAIGMKVPYGKDTVPVVLVNGHGDAASKPVVGEGVIEFNGVGPDHDHETFCVKQEAFNDFCKTARKPYDIAAVAILAYGAAKFGFEVGSDGDVLDWGAGTALACTATGEPIPNPLMVDHMKGESR